MQRGGAGRVSTASPGERSARRRPARPQPRSQRAEKQVFEAQPRQRRAAAAQVRPGPDEGRATGRGVQTAAHPPWVGVSREEGRTEQRVPVTPERCSRGSAVPQLLEPPRQGEKEAGDSEAGLFWRLGAPLGAGERSDTSLWRAALKDPRSKQPPAGPPEKPPAPGERGHIATRARALHLGEPQQVSAERSPRSSEKGPEGKGRGQQPAGRPLTPVHTHPARQARSRGAPLGALVPRRLLSRVPAPLGYRPGWGIPGDVHIRHGD